MHLCVYIVHCICTTVGVCSSFKRHVTCYRHLLNLHFNLSSLLFSLDASGGGLSAATGLVVSPDAHIQIDEAVPKVSATEGLIDRDSQTKGTDGTEDLSATADARWV